MIDKPYHHGDLRAAMLTAAETVLIRDGYDALTLRGASREAGVSHAAPKHHFGDLSGLLTELAIIGFRRLGTLLAKAGSSAGDEPSARLIAQGATYVGFARSEPQMFRLMTRSERLSWSRAELKEAAGAAFATLTTDFAGPEVAGRVGPEIEFHRLVTALTRLSLVHGMATLSLDGRLDGFACRSGVDVGALIAAITQALPGVGATAGSG